MHMWQYLLCGEVHRILSCSESFVPRCCSDIQFLLHVFCFNPSFILLNTTTKTNVTWHRLCLRAPTAQAEPRDAVLKEQAQLLSRCETALLGSRGTQRSDVCQLAVWIPVLFPSLPNSGREKPLKHVSFPERQVNMVLPPVLERRRKGTGR